MVATFERELEELEAVADAATRVARTPATLAARDPYLREASSHIGMVARKLLETWRGSCAEPVRGDLAARVSEWQGRVRAMVRLLSELLSEKGQTLPPDAVVEWRRLLAAFERLAAGLSSVKDDESWLALIVKWLPLDEEEFARLAREKPFIPPQAMYDEDWSRLLTDEPG